MVAGAVLAVRAARCSPGRELAPIAIQPGPLRRRVLPVQQRTPVGIALERRAVPRRERPRPGRRKRAVARGSVSTERHHSPGYRLDLREAAMRLPMTQLAGNAASRCGSRRLSYGIGHTANRDMHRRATGDSPATPLRDHLTVAPVRLGRPRRAAAAGGRRRQQRTSPFRPERRIAWRWRVPLIRWRSPRAISSRTNRSRFKSPPTAPESCSMTSFGRALSCRMHL